MPHVLVIGIGNTIRGDDAAAAAVIQQLEELPAHPDLEIIAVHQLAPELAVDVSRAAWVVFIDAAVGAAPGIWSRVDLDPAADANAPATLAHHLTPQALLACAGALFGARPPAVLFTIAGESFAFGQPLSAPVAAALPALTAAVTDFIREKLPPCKT